MSGEKRLHLKQNIKNVIYIIIIIEPALFLLCGSSSSQIFLLCKTFTTLFTEKVRKYVLLKHVEQCNMR